MATSRRRAVSLVEVLVVIGLLAVLVGLLLPAVQSVRAAAVRSQAANQQRQIALGLLLFADAHDGVLPGPLDATVASGSSGRRDYSPLYHVWPHLDGGTSDFYGFVRSNGGAGLATAFRRAFLSPADPTYSLLPADRTGYEYTSFSANMRGLAGQPRLPAGIPDGTSSTIAYAERYAVLPPTDPRRPQAWVWYQVTDNRPLPPATIYRGNHSRRATFADDGQLDVVPVTAGTPPVSRSSEPGVTFLAKPAYRDDYSHVLQSPYPTGLQVAFFDGSVRFLRAGVSEQTFWGMVTRDGGEVISE